MKKIGIIGAGYIGKSHAEGWFSIKDVKICGICDKNHEKASIIAEKYDTLVYTDLEELLQSGIDVLDVCVPTKYHYATVMNAFQKNISVLCEKPMALTLEEAEVMVKTAGERNLTFMIAHCVRFDPNYAYIKKVIENQLYGKLKSVRIYRDSAIPLYSESQWLLDTNLSGGVSMDLHVHDVDLIYWFLGLPNWVFTRNNSSSINTSYGYDNIVATTEATWRTQNSFPFNAGYDIQFEQATLTYSGGTLNLYTDKEEKILDNIAELLSISEISGSSIYYNEIAYFYNCLVNHIKPDYCLPNDSLNAHNILMSEIESGQSGNKIEIISKECV